MKQGNRSDRRGSRTRAKPWLHAVAALSAMACASADAMAQELRNSASEWRRPSRFQAMPPKKGNPPPGCIVPLDRWSLSNYHPVDAGVADINELGMSLRLIETGLQFPTGFSRVFEVPNTDLLMRVDGALHAVFPSSRYLQTAKGEYPLVPDDTTFFIGPPEFGDISQFEHGLRGAAELQDAVGYKPMERARRVEHRMESSIGMSLPTATLMDMSASVRRGFGGGVLRRFTSNADMQAMKSGGRSGARDDSDETGAALPSLLGTSEDLEQLLIAERPGSLNRDGRAAESVRGDATAAAEATIANDASYRAARMRELMQMAAGVSSRDDQ